MQITLVTFAFFYDIAIGLKLPKVAPGDIDRQGFISVFQVGLIA